MAQSLSQLYLHLIFHIKSTSPVIRDADQDRVYQYIGQLVNTTGCSVIQVGGTGDHIHILFSLAKDVTVSYVVEEVKRNSSRWIKGIAQEYRFFAWQGGYAVFSVSQSVVHNTWTYIRNQHEHHKKRSFEDEYRDFLKTYHVDYKDEYLFSD